MNILSMYIELLHKRHWATKMITMLIICLSLVGFCVVPDAGVKVGFFVLAIILLIIMGIAA